MVTGKLEVQIQKPIVEDKGNLGHSSGHSKEYIEVESFKANNNMCSRNRNRMGQILKLSKAQGLALARLQCKKYHLSKLFFQLWAHAAKRSKVVCVLHTSAFSASSRHHHKLNYLKTRRFSLTDNTLWQGHQHFYCHIFPVFLPFYAIFSLASRVLWIYKSKFYISMCVHF